MNLSDYYPQGVSFKNKIINGAMDVWQRGTTFTGVGTTETFSADRWSYSASTTPGILTLSREADVPANSNFNYSLRATVTTADAAITAADNYTLRQRIEGFNIIDLIGNTFTLSFWVRSAKIGVHCISLANSVSGASYVAEYTINAANTWEYKTITVTNGINVSVGGPWNTTNGLGLAVRFSFASGSTFQTATAYSWVAGDFFATPNQVNVMDTIGNVFAITGVQIERGAVATPFEYRPIGIELALCQRYFQITSISVATSGAGLQVQYGANWSVYMRASPTAVFSGSGVAPTVSYNSWLITLAPNENLIISSVSAEL